MMIHNIENLSCFCVYSQTMQSSMKTLHKVTVINANSAKF